MDYVVSIHDLHIWQLVDGMVIASVHLLVEEGGNLGDVLYHVKRIFHEHGIHSSSIQPEFVPVSTPKQAVCSVCLLVERVFVQQSELSVQCALVLNVDIVMAASTRVAVWLLSNFAPELLCTKLCRGMRRGLVLQEYCSAQYKHHYCCINKENKVL